MIFGLILAGGRSSRFGRDKATALLAGKPMIAWVVAALQSETSRLAISAHAGSPAAAFARKAGLPCLPDPPGSEDGPLSGVLEGLRWAAREGAAAVVTAPCDTPFLPSDYGFRMVEGAAGGSAVASTSAGLEPLCAVWPIIALAMLEGVTGHPPVGGLLEKLSAAKVDFPKMAEFENLNTPQAFTAAERRMAERL